MRSTLLTSNQALYVVGPWEAGTGTPIKSQETARNVYDLYQRLWPTSNRTKAPTIVIT